MTIIEAASVSVNAQPVRTPHGFTFGAADITACCSDEKRGWTITRIKTPKATVDIYVTKTGKTSVFFNGLKVAW